MNRRPSTESIGEKFGRLVVLEIVGKDNSNSAVVLCQCDCGSKHKTGLHGLRTGKTSSCGCYKLEVSRRVVTERNTTHGKAGCPEYKSWQHMKGRCLNPKNPKYRIYGGRGITICPEWRHDFAAFLAHIGRRPGAGYSVERIDNSLGYQPGNVKWATRIEQMRNTRQNHVIEFKGQKMTLVEWSERLGIDRFVLSSRLNRYSWTVERALTQVQRKAPRRRVA